jgi:pimeloyl-ACP methyl ester carboxylesterase
MPKEKMPDVIVFLPGVTGSTLKWRDEIVWGWSVNAGLRALFSRGKYIIGKLKLQDDTDPERETLDDEVSAVSVISDLHLIPDLWKIDGYTKITDVIKREFDVNPGRNYFELPYDWRRDNRAAAWKLKRRVHEWLKAWRDSSGNSDAKLILIGHSMGGLVSRYFLECLDGWKDTRALITFGTPYRGSLNAVNTLANGEKKGPFGVLDLTPFTSSLTSIYQLMPIYPVYDAGDGTDLQRLGEVTGIRGIDAQRAADALRFHREIEAGVTAHEQNAAYRANRHHIFPVVGTHQPTSQSARFDGSHVVTQESYRGQDLSGDGTVPRVSATPIEYKGDPMYAATRHGSLQNADPVLVQLRGVLTSLYLNLDTFRKGDTSPGQAHVSLAVDDLYWTGQPITIRARADQENKALIATLFDADTGAEVASRPLIGSIDGWQHGELAPVGAGVYRIAVSGDKSVTPVADIFEVIDEQTLEA